MLARNQLHMFLGTYCKKKKRGGEAILSTTTENLVTPAPPTPNKGSIREIATGEITLPITPDDHLEGPYLLKTSRASRGSAPWAPAGALQRAPGPHPYEARGALHARIFPPTPFFCKSPPRIAPRGVDPGGAGEQSPPPPHENIGGGGGKTYRFAPPPNSFVNLEKLIICNAK